uniref:Uncharacterized protein n=1 Tax=Solanum lycopersicum TaxID=4081 RepID=A0A3Q7EQY2_SOLLC
MYHPESPKGVLHSVEESAENHPCASHSVSFKIVVIESEDDLLCARDSPSLLPLLFSGLGIHLGFLNKLNASDGSFKLFGYISGPDVYTVKVCRSILRDKRCEESLKDYLIP